MGQGCGQGVVPPAPRQNQGASPSSGTNPSTQDPRHQQLRDSGAFSQRQRLRANVAPRCTDAAWNVSHLARPGAVPRANPSSASR